MTQFWPTPAFAAPQEDSGEASKDKTSQTRIEQHELETFYLRREDGSLVPFLNIPYEEFDQLYRLQRKLAAPDQPPRFVISEAKIDGAVQGKIVVMDVSLKIVLQADGWVRVPIRFDRCVLRSSPPQSSKQLLEFDHEDGGHVLRMSGQPGQVTNIKLKFACKLNRVGRDQRIEIVTPRATVAKLALKVPSDSIVASASENVILNPPKSLQGGQTELSVEGLSGEFYLAWRNQDRTVDRPTILNGRTTSIIRFDSDRRIRAEGVIRVTSLGPAIESYLVRLPPGMRLIQVADPTFDVAELLSDDKRLKGCDESCRFVEVRFKRPTTSPGEVRLLAELSRTNATARAAVELAGFEVLDAVSQSGSIYLAAANEWAIDWTPGVGVEQVEEIADSLRKQGVVARFDFVSQPFSLLAQVTRKKKRTHVEPRYEVQITADRVSLLARLRVRMRGATIAAVDVDFSGWTIEEVVSNDLEALGDIDLATTAPLKVPLTLPSQDLSDDFEITVRAFQVINNLDETLTVTLPNPSATSRTPAEVVIRPADNVDVEAIDEQMQSLTSVQDLATAESTSQQRLMLYRGRGDASPLVFVGKLQLLSQTVDTNTVANVTLGEQSTRVEQEVAVSVRREPLSRMSFDVPAQVAVPGNLRVFEDGEVVEWQLLGEVDSDRRRQRIAIDLSAARLGDFSIRLEMTLPLEDLSGPMQQMIQLAIPIERNLAGTSTSQVEVVYPRGWIITADDDAWKAVPDSSTSNSNESSFLCESEQHRFALILDVQPSRVAVEQDSILRLAWIQTWFTPQQRRDRAVFRLRTSSNQIRMSLPLGAELTDVAIDGVQVTDRVNIEEEDLVVLLDETEQARDITLEVWYSFAEARTNAGSLTVDFIQLLDVASARRLFWQLVLPDDEHLLVRPKQLTGEQVWRWQGLYWGQTASLRQRDLERLTMASRQVEVPGTANQYLFSSFGAPEQINVTTASRRGILLVVSFVVLAIGLLLIYVPVLRHPAFMLLLAVTLMAAGLMAPGPALLAVQIATLGVIAVLAVLGLRWVLGRPHVGSTMIRGTSMVAGEMGTTATVLATRDVPSSVATTTAGLPVESPGSASGVQS